MCDPPMATDISIVVRNLSAKICSGPGCNLIWARTGGMEVVGTIVMTDLKVAMLRSVLLAVLLLPPLSR